MSGDTSEEAEKEIQKTYVCKKADRLMREADEEDSEQSKNGLLQEEELKIAKNAKGITQNQMLNKLASNRSQSPYQEAKASLTT